MGRPSFRDEPKKIAANLARLRERIGASQTEVAKAIGVKQPTYYEWEQGICRPSLPNLQKLCDYFKVTMDELIGNETTTITDPLLIKKYTDEERDYLEKIRKNLTLNLIRLRDETPQIKIAKAIGVNREIYDDWEQGRDFPSKENLQKLAKYFKVSRDELVSELLMPSLKQPFASVPDLPSGDHEGSVQ